MGRRNHDIELFTALEAYNQSTVDQLKPLIPLITTERPKRKAELVDCLVNHMLSPKCVKALYETLDGVSAKAVQEATHDSTGELNQDRFAAKYGTTPSFHEADTDDRSGQWSYYDRRRNPTTLCLFFPQYSRRLPTDLRQVLLSFVPKPAEYRIPVHDEIPSTVRHTWNTWKQGQYVEEGEEVPLRTRHTTAEAEHDLKAILRLIETGKVRVSDKKRQPTAATVRAITNVLHCGDFYAEDDQEDDSWDPASNLAIKAFAWVLLLQAAGLAQRSGDKLNLAPAGRKSLSGPTQETIRLVWKKWRSSTLLDEFSRVEPIKGQQKGMLSGVGGRRQVVTDGLAECPIGRWIAVDDFFRFLRANNRQFVMCHRPWQLFISERKYGSLGYDDAHAWEQLQGRYILAFLFEYAATLGLLDVAYVVPQGTRSDFRNLWGTDELSCLSRYDGLLYFRINALGAWILGMSEKYQPPAAPVAKVLSVLPNLDVVVSEPPLPAADYLFLERFAEKQSDNVWRLSREKIGAMLEESLSLEEVTNFLAARNVDALPQTAQSFLKDIQQRAEQLADGGLARIIECRDGVVAKMLASDPGLRSKCELAGERWLIYRLKEETAVRRCLRRLGYILPAQKD